MSRQDKDGEISMMIEGAERNHAGRIPETIDWEVKKMDPKIENPDSAIDTQFLTISKIFEK